MIDILHSDFHNKLEKNIQHRCVSKNTLIAIILPIDEMLEIVQI